MDMEILESSHTSQPLPRQIKTVCILGGSKLVGHIQYVDMANRLVKELGRQEINILYGGTNNKLLARLIMAAQSWGIRVSSVIPFHLVGSNTRIGASSTMGPAGLGLQAQSIHNCMMYMMNNSDAFIVLPGGYNTLEEIFNIASLAQWNFHVKPIGLLNINNFFDGLLAFLDQGVNNKFISHSARKILISASTVDELLIKFHAYVQESVEAQVRRSQTTGVKRKRNSDPLNISL